MLKEPHAQKTTSSPSLEYDLPKRNSKTRAEFQKACEGAKRDLIAGMSRKAVATKWKMARRSVDNIPGIPPADRNRVHNQAQERYALIVEELKKGRSHAEVRIMFGVCKETVCRARKELGLLDKARQSKEKFAQIVMADRLATQASIASLAKKYKQKPCYIHRLIRNMPGYIPFTGRGCIVKGKMQVPQAEADEMIKMLKEGHNMTSIGKKVGYSNVIVKRVILANGLEVPSYISRLPLKEVLYWWENGLHNFSEISKKVGRSRICVKHILHILGIKYWKDHKFSSQVKEYRYKSPMRTQKKIARKALTQQRGGK